MSRLPTLALGSLASTDPLLRFIVGLAGLVAALVAFGISRSFGWLTTCRRVHVRRLDEPDRIIGLGVVEEGTERAVRALAIAIVLGGVGLGALVGATGERLVPVLSAAVSGVAVSGLGFLVWRAGRRPA